MTKYLIKIEVFCDLTSIKQRRRAFRGPSATRGSRERGCTVRLSFSILDEPTGRGITPSTSAAASGYVTLVRDVFRLPWTWRIVGGASLVTKKNHIKFKFSLDLTTFKQVHETLWTC